MYLVRSDEHGAHNLLKPEVLSLGLGWRIQWYVRVYQSRDETGSLCRPDLNSSTRCIIPYINGSESSSLYTCNTSWHSVHYMLLNKPLVRPTTVHYQSTVSMLSFAQVLNSISNLRHLLCPLMHLVWQQCHLQNNRLQIWTLVLFWDECCVRSHVTPLEKNSNSTLINFQF